MTYTPNKKYWAEHRHEFAAHVSQPRDSSTGPQTTPEHLTTARHGAFLRVPLEDRVLWGFSSDLHAQRFIDDFGGALLPPTA